MRDETELLCAESVLRKQEIDLLIKECNLSTTKWMPYLIVTTTTTTRLTNKYENYDDSPLDMDIYATKNEFSIIVKTYFARGSFHIQYIRTKSNLTNCDQYLTYFNLLSMLLFFFLNKDLFAFVSYSICSTHAWLLPKWENKSCFE